MNKTSLIQEEPIFRSASFNNELAIVWAIKTFQNFSILFTQLYMILTQKRSKTIRNYSGKLRPYCIELSTFQALNIIDNRLMNGRTMGVQIIVEKPNNNNSLECAPPLRVVAIVTLFTSTLDLIADFLLCSRIFEYLTNYRSAVAHFAAYGYFFFTGVSILIYIFEMTDVCLTLKNDYEDVCTARLTKSLVLAGEEVSLPGLLYIMFINEPRISLANPIYMASWIKLIALVWGVVKFTKLRFFWCCLPLNPKHEFRENLRRCFSFTLYRTAMIFVNIFHIFAILIVINNIIISGSGGKPIVSH